MEGERHQLHDVRAYPGCASAGRQRYGASDVLRLVTGDDDGPEGAAQLSYALREDAVQRATVVHAMRFEGQDARVGQRDGHPDLLPARHCLHEHDCLMGRPVPVQTLYRSSLHLTNSSRETCF